MNRSPRYTNQKLAMLWRELPIGAAAWLDREAWLDGTVTLLKAHARDQRHLCAEAVPFLGKIEDVGEGASEARAAALAQAFTAVRNAPAPGQGGTP